MDIVKPFRMDKMDSQKPTEAVAIIAKFLVPHTVLGIHIREGNTAAIEQGNRAAAEILTALSSAGFVIVPRYPTGAMIDTGACYEDPDSLYANHPIYDEGDLSSEVYRAMISAAEKD